jgi:hypothetical protein
MCIHVKILLENTSLLVAGMIVYATRMYAFEALIFNANLPLSFLPLFLVLHLAAWLC